MNRQRTRTGNGSSKSGVLEIRLKRRKLVFTVTAHARKRARSRGVSHKSIEQIVKDAGALLKREVSKDSTNTKFIIPDAGRGAALLVSLNTNGGTIITVLDYPLMAMPEDAVLLDHR